MTLVAIRSAIYAEDVNPRSRAAGTPRPSVRYRLLGRKDYIQQHSLACASLDYVLMFYSVEPAFLLANDRQPELISEALQNNIMQHGPTLLVACALSPICGA